MSVRKLSRMLFLVNGLQLVLGFGILIGLWGDFITYSEEIQNISIIMVLLGAMISTTGLVSLLRYQKKNYEESLKGLENLNLKLHEQRHDYLNQMQIVNGLLELGEFESARDYLQPVFKDIMKVSRALKTSQPAVNALLQAKMEEAERQGIDFYLEVGAQLRGLSVEPWELCKILANLIDNAVTALSMPKEGGKGQSEEAKAQEDRKRTVADKGQDAETGERTNLIDNAVTALSMPKEGGKGQSEEAKAQEDRKRTVADKGQDAETGERTVQDGERWIRLGIGENQDEHLFLIRNNGPEIPKAQQKLIFGVGYTTKKEEGHGMGLAIVSSILKEVGGRIRVNSSPEETSFAVAIPKAGKRMSVYSRKMTG